MRTSHNEVVTLMEGFGLPHIENIDMCRFESWPLNCDRPGCAKKMGKWETYQPVLSIPEGDDPYQEQDIDFAHFIPMVTAICHDYIVLQDGANVHIPYTYWHPYFKQSVFDYRFVPTPIPVGTGTPTPTPVPPYETPVPVDAREIRWSFYGGYHEDEDHNDLWQDYVPYGFEAYRADLAHTFTFGSRMIIFDVDRAVKENGDNHPYNIDPGVDVIVDFLTEQDADPSKYYLKHLISRYAGWGYPTVEDCAADGLLLGEFIRTPPFHGELSDFDNPLVYDTMTFLANSVFDEDEHKNRKLHAPPVLHSYWKADISDPGDSPNYRLMFAFTNYTHTTDPEDPFPGRSYTLKTEPIDITEYLPCTNCDYVELVPRTKSH